MLHINLNSSLELTRINQDCPNAIFMNYKEKCCQKHICYLLMPVLWIVETY